VSKTKTERDAPHGGYMTAIAMSRRRGLGGVGVDDDDDDDDDARL